MREVLKILGGSLDGLRVQWEGIAQWVFFHRIFDFIDEEIKTFQVNMLNEMLIWLSGVALVVVTLWILWQGYRVLQGHARNAMELVVDGARAAFIASLALTMTLGNADAYDFLSKTLPRQITEVMTGQQNKDASDIIDENMTAMEAAMIGIDALTISTEGSENLKADKDRAMWLAGVGVAGPSLVGGALLVMYKVALALFVGFAPLFILCLIFKQTQSLFHKWLLYGIGTMFSQSLMAFMAVLVMKIVLAVSGAFAAQYALAASTGLNPQSVSSMAMMQGGIGLLLTLSLVTIPPTAAYFFQGTLGSYMSYSAFGGNGGSDRPGQRYGERGNQGQPAPVNTNGNDGSQSNRQSPGATNQGVIPYNPGKAASQDVTKTGVEPNRLRG